MTRSFSSVAKWVLCIVLIALIIVTFAFGLLSSSGASVASAMSVDISDDGIVSDNNLLPYSWYSDITTENGWNRSLSSTSSDYGKFSSSGSNSNYFCLFYVVQLQPGTYTLSLSSCPDSASDFDYGTYDFRLAYSIKDNTAQMVNLVNRSESYIGVFDVTSITFTVESLSNVTVGLFNCNDGLFSEYVIDIKFFKLEAGSSFTGYVHSDISTDDIYNEGYEAGYNQGKTDGHEQGYEEGYKQGTSDGLISANSIFVCSRYQVKSTWDKNLNTYVNSLQSYSSDHGDDLPFVCKLMNYIPLSCLVYNDDAECLLPKDLTNSYDPAHPNVSYLDSKYLVHFDSFLELGQWLLDNPDDYLCTQYYTQEMVFDALVFLDLSKLSNFMSGSGESYQVGYDHGYDTGHHDGQQSGYSQGYNAGYNKGAMSGADYSFLGLIGAVVDAPINAFQGLLDFDILGVNMSSFVMAMFSLCFIFLLLKLVLR